MKQLPNLQLKGFLTKLEDLVCSLTWRRAAILLGCYAVVTTVLLIIAL